MKRTYVIQVWTGQYMQAQVLTRLRIAAPSMEMALDKAQARSRAMNRLPEHQAHLKADYLLCGGFMRLVG